MAQRDFAVKAKDLLLTNLNPDDKTKIRVRARQAVGAIHTIYKDYQSRRQDKEEAWKRCWAHYLSTPQTAKHIRATVKEVVGNVEYDWRHRIPHGKGYEIVETINSYLQAAFFPNKNWFDLIPKYPLNDPDYKKFLRVLSKYINHKLEGANLQDHWDIFTRQLIITGTSVLALPWRYDTKKCYKNALIRDPHTGEPTKEVINYEKVIYNGLEIETLDMFDVYLCPEGESTYEGNLIRRLVKTKGEVLRLIEEGIYPYGVREDILEAKPYAKARSEHRQEINSMMGDNISYHPNDQLELYEFWGDLIIDDYEFKDVVATVCGDSLLLLESNPFWEGKPFIVGNYTPIQGTPYGMGALEPVLGQLHKLFISSNHRMDISEITINPMWEVLNDGATPIEEVYSYPGKVLPVGQMGSVRPIARDMNVSVSVEEEALLEGRIDKCTGLGNYIGVNSGRAAERVTAEEIRAQRDAGGNRLNRIHKHIEITCLMRLLQKTYSYLQQFVVKDEIVRVKGDMPEAYEYIQVGLEELQYELDVIPKGADHVADREFELRQRLDFISTVGQVPQMSERVNWEELLKDLARRFLVDDWEVYITEAPPAPAMPPGMGMPPTQVPLDPATGATLDVPPDQMEAIYQQLEQMGGAPARAIADEAILSGRAPDMLSKMTPPLPPPIQ